MEIGNQPVSKMIPFLKQIAKEYGLKLSNPKDFKTARKILAIRFIFE